MWETTSRACRRLPAPRRTRKGVNRLAVLTGGRVVLTGGGLLPGSPAGYAGLQSALHDVSAVPPQMAW